MKIAPTLVLVLAGLVATVPACKGAGRESSKREPLQLMSVIPLQYAVAGDVANALNKLHPGCRLVADERTNSLVISCPAQTDLRELTKCIAQLDVPVSGNVVGR